MAAIIKPPAAADPTGGSHALNIVYVLPEFSHTRLNERIYIMRRSVVVVVVVIITEMCSAVYCPRRVLFTRYFIIILYYVIIIIIIRIIMAHLVALFYRLVYLVSIKYLNNIHLYAL